MIGALADIRCIEAQADANPVTTPSWDNIAITQLVSYILVGPLIAALIQLELFAIDYDNPRKGEDENGRIRATA